jgi:hypothetical protein
MSARNFFMGSCVFLSVTVLPVSSMSASLGFENVPATIGVGQNFTVDVVLSNMTDMNTVSFYDFNINFDAAILEFSGVTFGTGLGVSDQGTQDLGGGLVNVNEFSYEWFDISDPTDPSYDPDPSSPSYSTFFADQFDGTNDMILFSIDFLTLTTGSSTLNIVGKDVINTDPVLTTIDVGNEYYEGLDLTTTGASVNVVPEPTTMMLFGAGCAGLAFSRRKKKA